MSPALALPEPPDLELTDDAIRQKVLNARADEILKFIASGQCRDDERAFIVRVLTATWSEGQREGAERVWLDMRR